MAAIIERRLNLFSWVFCSSAPSIAELMKFLQRTNVKEKSREQELTGTEVARKIAKESGRGLKKGGENTGKIVLNNAVKSSESRRR